MPELEQFLDEMRSEGSSDSSGQFGLDIKRAREKLGHLFTDKPGEFLLFWIRFAIFNGAPAMDLDIGATRVKLDFPAQGPEMEEVRSLFAQSNLGLRYLSMAVLGALKQGYTAVELRTPRLRARFTNDTQTLERESDPQPGCWLQATRELRGTEKLRSRLTDLLGRAQPLLTPEDLPFLTTTLRMRGKSLLPSGFVGRQHLLLTTSSELARRCSLSTEVYLVEDCAQPGLGTISLILPAGDSLALAASHLTLVVHGVHYPALHGYGLPPDARVVVETDDARLDLAMLQLADAPLDEQVLRQLPLTLMDILVTCLSHYPRLLERIPMGVVEWLTDLLCRLDRRLEAHNMCQDVLPRLPIPLNGPVASGKSASPHPIEAALLERAAVLSGLQFNRPDTELLRRAEGAWQSLYERESMWARSDSFQGVWHNLVESGAVHLPPEEAWLATACLELSPSAAIAFYRETVRRSVHADGLNPELFEYLWRSDQSSLARNFLVARHLVRKRSTQLPAYEASACARRLLGTASDAPRLYLGETEKRHIYALVEQLCQLGVESLNEEATRLSESAAWVDSQVLLAQIREDERQAEKTATPLRFEFTFQRAIACRLLERRQEGEALLLALVQELRLAPDRYTTAEGDRLRGELQFYGLEEELTQ